MSKIKLPYDVKNNLDELIKKEVGKRMAQTGVKVLQVDIMVEVAKHCGVGYDNIKRIKRNISQPSLGVALKIASFFNTSVEDIFKIKEEF
jgi:DNA-binding XRE family transcriptional regulator